MTNTFTPKIAAGLVALSLLGATSAFAQTATTEAAEVPAAEDTMAEAQAFLSSATSMSAAIVAAEKATGGKVSSIEFQNGEDGGPDLIMADVIMADGTEKTVAINPADGSVMKVTDAEMDGGEQQGDTEGDDNAENGDDENGGAENGGDSENN